MQGKRAIESDILIERHVERNVLCPSQRGAVQLVDAFRVYKTSLILLVLEGRDAVKRGR